MKEPINKVTLKDGSIRYRLVVDIGRDERGRRKQLTRTFDTRREAREELCASGTKPTWEPTSNRPRRR
jgi:hypothetical protein